MSDHGTFVTEVQQLAAEMVPEVLEAMFFATAAPSADAQCTADSLNVRLLFRGVPSGIFGLTVDRVALRELASAFLGRDTDEIGDVEEAQVACELANILCGSVLSRAESDTGFELDPPEVIDTAAPANPDHQAQFLLDVGGAVEVRFGVGRESQL